MQAMTSFLSIIVALKCLSYASFLIYANEY